MFTFDLELPLAFPGVEISDPRGGRTINMGNGQFNNNLHVPYRGGDFNMVPIDPAGAPTGYLWMLPYAEDTLSDTSTLRALSALKAKAAGTGGSNAQRWAGGMSFGVTQDG